MFEWIEKTVNTLMGEPEQEPKKLSAIEIQAQWKQLKQVVHHLLKQLNEGNFKFTPIGKDVLSILESFKTRLIQKDVPIDARRLQQEKQNFTSFFKSQTLEIKLYLTGLNKRLEQVALQGRYQKNLTRHIQELTDLLNAPQEVEFGYLCQKYTQFYRLEQTLNEKLKAKQESLKPEPKIIVEKEKIKSLSYEELERKNRLLEKVRGFTQQIDTYVNKIEESPFKNFKAGKDTLTVLLDLKNKFQEGALDFSHFNEEILTQESRGLHSFLITQTKEIKDYLRQIVVDLQTKRQRGFCLDGIDNLSIEANSLIEDEPISFVMLGDRYAKACLLHENLNTKIMDAARLKHAEFLHAKDSLELDLKYQAVETSTFLTDREKQDFLSLTDSVKQECQGVTPENIKQDDIERIISSRKIPEKFSRLIGDHSLSFERETFCETVKNILSNKVGMMSTDNGQCFLEIVKQNLLSTGNSKLETEHPNKHPLISLTCYLTKINNSVRNLRQFSKAYEYFVKHSPLNFHHTKSGVEHANQVVSDAVEKITQLFNQEFESLLQEIIEKKGHFTHNDLKGFARTFNDKFLKWQQETVFESAKKSGFHIHSFNNYLKLWMSFSPKDQKDSAFTEVFSISRINQAIRKQKSSFDLTLFGNSGDTKFEASDLESWVNEIREQVQRNQDNNEQQKNFGFSTDQLFN